MTNEIQEDLRNGMSINDACAKYGLTFKELCDRMPRHHPPKKQAVPTSTNEKNINCHDEVYYVRKTINKKTLSFGSYDTLEDAIRVRDYMVKHGWHKDQVNRCCRELGITRRESSNGVHTDYGV